ncbi:MAG TPA: hypothetical protein VK540_00285 [Polyangiaceae bacterium]|jgi:hypothetical protein|nr:hypothetical protein [Polyangiaceae bacterium]
MKTTPIAFCVLFSVGCSAAPDADDAVDSVAPEQRSDRAIVFAPGAHPLGRSMIDWSQRWWQWIFAVPAAENPMLDVTGVHCDEGQEGPVWFLASVLDPGGTATISRACTLPKGKPVLISPASLLNDYPCPNPDFHPAPGQSLYDFLREGARPAVDIVNGMTITLDGRTVAHPFDYRYASPHLFSIRGDVSLKPVLDGCITGTRQPAVMDGYFMMLKALDEGAHRLTVRVTDTKGTDVTVDWTLTVRGR